MTKITVILNNSYHGRHSSIRFYGISIRTLGAHTWQGNKLHPDNSTPIVTLSTVSVSFLPETGVDQTSYCAFTIPLDVVVTNQTITVQMYEGLIVTVQILNEDFIPVLEVYSMRAGEKTSFKAENIL